MQKWGVGGPSALGRGRSGPSRALRAPGLRAERPRGGGGGRKASPSPQLAAFQASGPRGGRGIADAGGAPRGAPGADEVFERVTGALLRISSTLRLSPFDDYDYARSSRASGAVG